MIVTEKKENFEVIKNLEEAVDKGGKVRKAFNEGIYAFSGDPIHYGHIDIIQKAAEVLDKVYVTFAINPGKTYMFTLEERMAMARKALSHLSNIEVIYCDRLIADLACDKKIKYIVKGVRNIEDFEEELANHRASQTQHEDIVTIIFIADKEFTEMRSSLVKEINKHHGKTHELVPLHVKQKLEEKEHGQCKLFVTGEIGVGKSYVSEELVKIGEGKGIEVHNIELDHIGHKILGDKKRGTLMEPYYVNVRKEIAETFKEGVMRKDGTIDRRILGEIVFNDPEKLDELNKIMYEPMMNQLRKEMRHKKGIILINAALVAESDMLYMSNNNGVLVKANEKSQIRRLKERGLAEEQIERRLKSQYNFSQKRSIIEKRIEKDNNGRVWILDNSDNSDPQILKDVFDNIVGYFKMNCHQ